MTEEDALQTGIREHPLDDLRRLVYADWLDEHGRPAEAEYLRLVAALAETTGPIDRGSPTAGRLLELTPRLPAEWRNRVGGRFDLWLDGYDLGQKIAAIKVALVLTWFGLAEAKWLCEALPARILLGDTFEACAAGAVALASATDQVRIIRAAEEPADRHRYAVHFSTNNSATHPLTVGQRRAAVSWLASRLNAPAGNGFDCDTQFTQGRVAGGYSRSEISRLTAELKDELPRCGHPFAGPRYPGPDGELLWLRVRRDETRP
jgi:uncharacterized protein (TIGR02996 family)